jgi:hypothetical protein
MRKFRASSRAPLKRQDLIALNMLDLTMAVADEVSARLSDVVGVHALRTVAESMIRNVALAMVTEVFTPVEAEGEGIVRPRLNGLDSLSKVSPY